MDMFKVGVKIRINSIPCIINVKEVLYTRTISLCEFCSNYKSILDFKGNVDPETLSLIYSLVAQVQTVEEIKDNKIYVSNYYMNFYNVEKVVDEPCKRISIRELRKVLNMK